MTTQDLATIDTNDMAIMAALTGQDGGQQMQPRDDGGFPRLRINTDHEDDKGNPLKAGTFAFYQNEKNWYAETVKFRPFLNGFQYLNWDPNGGKDRKGAYINKSIVIRSFKEEAIDEQGTIACGKIRNLEGMSPTVALQQKNIKCFRLVFGTVSGEFTDGPSKDAEILRVVDQPVALRLRGTNFMPIGDVFQEMSKNKKLIFQHAINFTLKREKSGQTVYYIIQPVLDETKVLPFGESEMTLFKQFDQLIKDVNSGIWKAHNAALSKTKSVAANADLAREFAKDFHDDDISDLGVR
jgi:hypothetical protein